MSRYKWQDVGDGEKRATYYGRDDEDVAAYLKGKAWRVCDGDKVLDSGVEDTDENARIAAEDALWCFGEDL